MSDNSTNWTEWLITHGPSLLLFARTKTRCEVDAEDLVQEAIVEAAKRDGGSTPDLPLVYATIRRRAIDLARSIDRRSAREKDVLAEKDPCWFDNTIEQKEASQLVDQAMKKMPEKYREVVVLKIWSDLTFAQIADTLGVPLNTAASRYRYGLEILKRDTNLKQS